MPKITLLYDNTAWRKTLSPDWGFACLIETGNLKILFDTGARGSLLLANMQNLQVDPLEIDAVFISHAHRDHTGGLADFLSINPAKVYLPECCRDHVRAAQQIIISEPLEIYPGLYSTGELQQVEQSLVIGGEKGSVVVAGCAHPGVAAILAAAKQFGPVRALVGGLHDFDDFGILADLETICPTHCTSHIEAIKTRFPGSYTPGGAGRVLQL